MTDQAPIDLKRLSTVERSDIAAVKRALTEPGAAAPPARFVASGAGKALGMKSG